MQSLNFFPHISRPTRFPNENSTASPSLLDQVWTNFTVPSSSGILLFPLSDHLPVFLNIPVLDKLNVKHKISFGLRNAENRSKFHKQLSEINWNSLLTYDDTNIKCHLFLDTVYSIYYFCFPKISKFISTKRLQKPWITQGIIKSIQHNFALHKSYKLGVIN